MASVRRAVFYSLGQRYIAFSLQLGTSIILARLLSPEETGIFSLASAAVGVAQLLREFGTGEYIISETNLTTEKLRAAFALMILSGTVIGLSLLLLAWPMARAYNEPGVAHVMALLALNFALLPLGSVAFGVLSKELAFDKIFIVQTAAGVVGATVTIGAAVARQSFLSPAIGSICSIGVTIVALALISPKLVFMKPSFRGMGQVLRFGGPLTLARVLDQMSSRSTDFVVSALLGFQASGLLSKAQSLLGGFHEFFTSALARVATPTLVRSVATPAALQESYTRAIVHIALVQWMFFGLLAVMGDEIILVLFGQTWRAAVLPMQLGCVSGVLWAPFMLHASLLTAKREVGWQLRIPLIAAPVLVACQWFGALHSLVAVAVWTVVASVVRLVVINQALSKGCGVSIGKVILALRRTGFASLCGVGTALLVKWVLLGLDAPAAAILAAGLAAGAGGGATAALTLKHPLAAEARSLWEQRRRGENAC
jgi:O-antigen/teichoic acid export membrane protein